MSKKFEQRKARKSPVLLGFCGFLAPIFQNSFLGVFGVKSGEKGVFGPNSCKSLDEENGEFLFNNPEFLFKLAYLACEYD